METISSNAGNIYEISYFLLGNLQGQIKISGIFRFKGGGHPANGARYLWGILQCQNYFGISSVALEQGVFSFCLSAAETVQHMRGGGWTTLEIHFSSTEFRSFCAVGERNHAFCTSDI